MALAGGESLAIFFAISGAGIAMIYPTVMAFIARRYPNGSDTAITFTVTLMGVGSVIGNYIIGWVIEGVKNMYGATTLTRFLCADYRQGMDSLVYVRSFVRRLVWCCTFI